MSKRYSEPTSQRTETSAEQDRSALYDNRNEDSLANRRWRRLMECSPYGIIVYLPDGRIKTYNPAMRRLFGMTEAEAQLVADSYNIFEDPQLEKRGQAEPIRKAFDGQPSLLKRILYEEKTPIERRTVRRWIEGVAFPVVDADQRLQEVVLMHSNVTELTEAQRSSANRLAELEQLYADTPVGLCLMDRDLRFLRINEALAAINGRSVDKHLGRKLRDVLPELALEIEPIYQRVIETGQPVLDHEVQGTTPARPGEQRIWLVSYHPVRAQDQAVVGVNTVVLDITARKKAMEDLRRSEERFREIAENIREVFWVYDLQEQGVTYVSPAWECIWGTRVQTLYKNPGTWEETIHPDDREIANGALARIIGGKHQEACEYRIVRPDGGIRWIADRGVPITDQAGNVVRVVGISEDITERRIAAERLEVTRIQYEKLFQDVKDAVFATTEDGRWQDINPAGLALFGYSSKMEFMETTSVTDFYIRGEDREKLKSQLARFGYVKDYEIELKTKTGESVVVLESSSVVKGTDGQVVGYHGILRDVTRQRSLEKEVERSLRLLEHDAYHDSLTDLPNRAALHRDFQGYLENEVGPNECIAILLIDLDRFKEVNDALGHHVGDQLLKQVGPRVNGDWSPARLRIYRLGGDEFAVILSGLSNKLEAAELAERVLDVIKEPFEVAGMSLEIGASAGVSVYPEFGVTSNELLRCADVAMYQAKRALSGVALYNRESDLNTPERLAIASDLRKAIEARELVVYYQPKVSLLSGCTVGFEALVRWQSKERGLLLPGDFLPLAEMGELIHPLTAWVIEEALAQLRRWRRRDAGLTMSINLSGRCLLDRHFAKKIEDIIEGSGVEATSVEFEITETVLMTDLQVAVGNLRRLVATGARLSIDDFGTGYSSFAYLKKFEIHTMKVDRGFVRDMLRSRQSRAIVLSAIQLASNLELQVVAEGVEDTETGKELRRMGCKLAQGFAYGRPRPAEDFGIADPSSRELTRLWGVGKVTADRLSDAGFETVGAIAKARTQDLVEATGLPSGRVATIRDTAAAATSLSRGFTEESGPADQELTAVKGEMERPAKE